jgi:hypothetical protein
LHGGRPMAIHPIIDSITGNRFLPYHRSFMMILG